MLTRLIKVSPTSAATDKKGLERPETQVNDFQGPGHRLGPNYDRKCMSKREAHEYFFGFK